jgi:predicted ATPase/Flp pilus assembly protein TadD
VRRDQWSRAEAILNEALDLPAVERMAYVSLASGGDPDLQRLVLSLLDAPAIDEMPESWLSAVAAPEPETFRPGQRVAGRYVIGRLIGRGGMGEVYEALDEDLSVTLALKTIHRAGSSDSTLQHLKLEGMLARAIWHPGVCRVYDLGHDDVDGDTVWFLTMELLRGETLADRLARTGPLPAGRVLPLVEELAAGLGAAHLCGVVHRDFKPGNVMLVPRRGGERAVITDFGTGRMAGAGLESIEPTTVDDDIIGTPAYMAPEQVRGESAGPGADIFALGVVLYQLISGALPFHGRTGMEMALKRLEEEPVPLRSLVPELDDRWNAVILRCLERDPRRRFSRAEDVPAALRGDIPIDHGGGISSLPDRTSLPPERDLFVGRETELRELEAAFRVSRVVTLMGAGGMGKTRLGAHFAWRNLGAWSGGVWFCDLTEVRSPDDVAATAARTLGVQLLPGDPVAQLGLAIAGHVKCLLILDSCEHAAGVVASTLGRWLEFSREARFLVTSRVRPGIAGETVLDVGSLAPEAGVELFESRARGLRPGLELDDRDADAVREIVRLVDGMPLAIELAAARVRVMDVPRIAEGMRRKFQLLSGGRSVRHETLFGMIDGSWELLNDWERAAWTQCSIFEGGFTLEAAEEVIDLSAWAEAPLIVEVIQTLLDKSLLRPIVGDSAAWAPEPRFGMYTSLQEYARLKLEAGPAAAVERRHGAWYARLGADSALHRLSGPDCAPASRRLAWEVDNLKAACRRGIDRADGPVVTGTFRALWDVALLLGQAGEMLMIGNTALDAGGFAPSERARVLLTLGDMEIVFGDVVLGIARLEAALEIARETGDLGLQAWIFKSQGRAKHQASRLDEALRHYEDSRRLASDTGDRRTEAEALNGLGMTLHVLGRSDEARRAHEESLRAAQAVGDLRTEAVTRSNLAALCHQQGDVASSLTHFHAALAIHRDMRNRRSEGITLLNLGNLECELGQLDSARTHVEAALQRARSMGSLRSEGIALVALGDLLGEQGRAAEALSHLEAALTIHRTVQDRRLEAGTLVCLGHNYLRAGSLVDAQMHLEEALTLARAIGFRHCEAHALIGLGRVHCRGDFIEEARRAIDEAEAILRGLGGRIDLAHVLCARAEVDWRDGDPVAARQALREARSIGDSVGAAPESYLRRRIEDVTSMLDSISGVADAPPVGRDDEGRRD